jgi:pSer/pThr/pTyr-binding forkhead associated (FHA) protein
VDQPIDIVSLSLRLELPSFVEQCAFPMLLAANETFKTLQGDPFAAETTHAPSAPEPPAMRPATGRPVVHAVRKIHTIIPFGIILGRAVTSDIVILDPRVSKTHALFEEEGGDWELSDAGSRNGTWVGNLRLEPKGEPAAVKLGDVLSFGHCAFFFLDAATCWQRIRERCGG